MKKWITLSLLLLVLVGIGADKSTNSGCGSGGKTATSSKVDPFIGGTQGVFAEFEPGYPPAEVYDNGQYPFDIDVKLTNVGETSVAKEHVRVMISGIKPEDFGVDGDYFIKDGIDEDLEATKKDAEGNIIEGAPIHVTFANLNYNKKLVGNFGAPIRADICYLYQTQAISDICVLDNVLTAKDQVCTVDEDKKVFNSGAPVQIASFKEVKGGTGKVRFYFTIKHSGPGRVFLPNTKCDYELKNENRIYVDIITELPGLVCSGLSGGSDSTNGVAILYNGERVISCTQEIGSQVAYENRVQMKLSYDYLEDVSSSILVKYSQ